MTLGLAYAIGFVLAGTTALTTVLASGELPPWFWVVVLVPSASAFGRSRGQLVPVWLGTLVGAGALVYGILVLQARGPSGVLLGATIALVGIFLARLLTRSTLKHDLQALMLSLLIVISGAGMNSGVSYGVAFIAYSVSVVWALVTRQLVEGAEREAALPFGAKLDVTLARRDIVTPVFFAASAMVSLVVLLSTSFLFVLFPRVGLGSFKMAQTGGLPDAVSLRGLPMAGGSGAVVARVKGVTETQVNRGLYLRAATYDGMRRDSFVRDNDLIAQTHRDWTRLAHHDDGSFYDVFLQPLTDNHLLLLGPTQNVKIITTNSFGSPIAQAYFRPNGEVDATFTGAIRYNVFGATMLSGLEVPETRIPAARDEANPWLTVPGDLDARIAPLAAQTIGDAATPSAKADALRSFLVRNFRYTLEQPNGSTSDPLSAFLFSDRRGHCEYFAAALAAMLRTVDVPARVVGGFQGGFWDDNAQLVVFTTEHAHAWVEWYDDDLGWVLDDATPPSDRAGGRLNGFAAIVERMRRTWDDYVVDYGIAEQFQMFAQVSQSVRRLPVQMPHVSLKNTLIAVGAAAALAFVVRTFRKRGFGGRRREAPLARGLLDALQIALERPLPQTDTMREGVRAAGQKLGAEHQLVRALEHALRIYERQRFGMMPDADATRALKRLTAARRALSS